MDKQKAADILNFAIRKRLDAILRISESESQFNIHGVYVYAITDDRTGECYSGYTGLYNVDREILDIFMEDLDSTLKLLVEQDISEGKVPEGTTFEEYVRIMLDKLNDKED